jgi:molybdopterin-guanine dinucleotide biosynthesis protein A
MPLVSPFEQMAEERGLEKGLQRGLQQRIDQDKELIIRLIQRKLGTINEDLQTQVKALNIDDLETLAEDLFDLNSIEDLQQWLNKFKVN